MIDWQDCNDKNAEKLGYDLKGVVGGVVVFRIGVDTSGESSLWSALTCAKLPKDTMFKSALDAKGYALKELRGWITQVIGNKQRTECKPAGDNRHQFAIYTCGLCHGYLGHVCVLCELPMDAMPASTFECMCKEPSE